MKKIVLDEILKNSSKLIKYKTISGNYSEFNKAYEFVKKELKNYFIKEIVINNYKNLVISNSNDNYFDVIFCGHMDVVPANKYIPIIEGNKLCGRGSFDMKSQLSVIISLLKHNKSNKKIAFIITSDEEIGGYCCKKIMENYSAKMAIIPDAGKNFDLVIEEKGLIQLEIITNGISAHASEPFNGDNAIMKSINIYNNILNIYNNPTSKNEYITSINLSKLIGGSAINSVAASSTMYLDIRFTKEDSKEQILSNIKKIANDSIINILDYGPVFTSNINSNQIKDFIDNATNVLNREVNISKCLATSDAIYFSEKSIPTVLMNPIGNNWHGPNEYVNIESLYTLYEIFKSVI